MANLFNSIVGRKPKRNVFNMSYDHKLTCNMGELIPFHVQEVIPGDRFTMRGQSLIRFSPLLAPPMHMVNVFMHYYFVPNRILWKNWQYWITGKKQVAPPTTGFAPGSTGTSVNVGDLADYMGLVPGKGYTASLGDDVNALPFAAYQAIWFEYYRDENMILPNDEWEDHQLNDGYQGSADRIFLGTLRKRAWKHDYFTSALPWPQKGGDVMFPLKGKADVGPWTVNNDEIEGNPLTWRKTTKTGPVYDAPSSGSIGVSNTGTTQDFLNSDIWPTNLKADLSTAQPGTSINELRKALRLQEWLEKNARGGTRYIENLLVHFGVRSSDKRLSRPEFIGGSIQPVTFSEVLQTSETNVSNTAQGSMSGHGVSVGSGKPVSYYAEEHGFIIGIMSIMPQPAYMQGTSRTFMERKDRLDYFWPSFAHLGEQPIFNYEIYTQGSGNAQDRETFGYIPRYAEYRYNPSRVSGLFRTSLEYWHLARKFSSLPTLSQQFIEMDGTQADMKRIFAVTSANEPGLYCHIYNDIKAVRPLPRFGTPSL